MPTRVVHLANGAEVAPQSSSTTATLRIPLFLLNPTTRHTNTTTMMLRNLLLRWLQLRSEDTSFNVAITHEEAVACSQTDPTARQLFRTEKLLYHSLYISSQEQLLRKHVSRLTPDRHTTVTKADAPVRVTSFGAVALRPGAEWILSTRTYCQHSFCIETLLSFIPVLLVLCAVQIS